MKLAVTAVVVLLALAGCTPNTDQAVQNCATSRAASLDDSPGDQNSEDLDRLVESFDLCQAAADRDPAGFNAKWG